MAVVILGLALSLAWAAQVLFTSALASVFTSVVFLLALFLLVSKHSNRRKYPSGIRGTEHLLWDDQLVGQPLFIQLPAHRHFPALQTLLSFIQEKASVLHPQQTFPGLQRMEGDTCSALGQGTEVLAQETGE